MVHGSPGISLRLSQVSHSNWRKIIIKGEAQQNFYSVTGAGVIFQDIFRVSG